MQVVGNNTVPRVAGRTARPSPPCTLPAVVVLYPRAQQHTAQAIQAPTFKTSPQTLPQPQQSRSVRACSSSAGAGNSTSGTSKAKSTELQLVSEDTSPLSRKVTITVPAAAVKQCFEAAVKNMRQIVGNLRGFRQDKVPLTMIVAHVGGQANFKATCLEELLSTMLPKAMDQVTAAQKVVSDSIKVATDFKELAEQYDPGQAFTFTVQYDMVPPLRWRSSYRDAQVTLQDSGDFSTDSMAVDQLVRSLLKEKGHQRVVNERGMQQGDAAVVTLNFMEQGSKLPLPGISADKTLFDSDTDPLDLMPNLVGQQVGETRRFQIRLPEDYRIELWQGMVCDVDVTLHELFEWALPQFSDELAKQLSGGKFTSVEEFRRGMLASTAMERMQLLDLQLGTAVKEAVVDCIEEMELPDSMLQELGIRYYNAALLNMVQQKVASVSEADKLATEAMLKEYIDKRRTELHRQLLFNLAVDEIWEQEGLTANTQQVAEELALRCKEFEAAKAEFDKDVVQEQVMEELKMLQVTEWLKDNIKRNVLAWNAAETGAAPVAAN